VLGVGAPGQVSAEGAEAYERLGELYDVWCASVDEDLAFYLAMCRDIEGPIIELGVGSGRVAVELLREGHELIGLDGSPTMLARARTRADEAGVGERLTLIEADFRTPPPLPQVERVIAPFRPFLHLRGDEERVATLRAARELLAPDGRLIFDVFEPTAADIRKTHDRFVEREAGIYERARWDSAERTIELAVRARGQLVTMRLEWRSAGEWRALCEQAGLRVVRIFAGFEGQVLEGDLPGDHAFVCERA
jgi:SAM-dependent methyltransferase